MRLLTAIVRRHRWWLVPEMLVLATLTAGLIFLSDRLSDQLSERARLILEQLPPDKLELYGLQGHEGHGGRVVCAAEVFGRKPATARRIEDVQVVYAHYLCALVQKGTPWDYATRSSGPAAISLSDPPTVQIAPSGGGYSDRVRAIVPKNLEREALAGFSDADRPSDLLARYNAAAGSP